MHMGGAGIWFPIPPSAPHNTPKPAGSISPPGPRSPSRHVGARHDGCGVLLGRCLTHPGKFHGLAGIFRGPGEDSSPPQFVPGPKAEREICA